MGIIKRHKGLAIVGSLTLALLVVLFLIFARMLVSSKESNYGDRLNGLVSIDTSIADKIIEEYKEKKEVTDISIRTQGRIIYFTIKFKEGTKEATAKSIASKVVTYYDEEVTDYYDFGFFLKEEKEDGYIIAGTKHPANSEISWTK